MASSLLNSYRNDNVANTPILVRAGNWAVGGWNLINPIGTTAYLKIYNSATAAAVVLGTTTPKLTLIIPASGAFWQSNEEKFQVDFDLGIVIAVTTGMADSSTTGPGTNCYVQLFYGANT